MKKILMLLSLVFTISACDSKPSRPIDFKNPEFWQTATVKEVKKGIKAGQNANEMFYERNGYGMPIKQGNTITGVALTNDNPELINILVKNGADVNDRAHRDRTPLMLACWHNASLKMIEALIKNGADVNAKDEGGMTALMRAVDSHKDIKVIELLLKNGADVNAVNRRGESVFTQALLNDKKEIAQILFDNGADAEATHQYLKNKIGA